MEQYILEKLLCKIDLFTMVYNAINYDEMFLYQMMIALVRSCNYIACPNLGNYLFCTIDR